VLLISGTELGAAEWDAEEEAAGVDAEWMLDEDAAGYEAEWMFDEAGTDEEAAGVEVG
jgi:hypothetical protein